MKILTRHTLWEITKVTFVTSLLGGFMLMGIDLFTHLDTYTGYGVAGRDIMRLTFLYFPEAFLMAMGPSSLFASTYYLSMLHANNEIICILNSGVNFSKLVRPIIVLALSFGLFYFVFNESVAIKCSATKEAQYKIVTGDAAGKLDNSDIALSDMFEGYMVYASQYVDSEHSVYNVSFIKRNNEDIERIDAVKASYDSSDKIWLFEDCTVHKSNNNDVITYTEPYIEVPELRLEPELFRNLSSEIGTMTLDLARSYVQRMKVLNPEEYASIGTDYYKRVLSFLTPIVLMLISISMNYRFKKNILFFSILCSVCVAVVYYVIQIMTIMFADQGIIHPSMGMLIPFIVIIILSFAQRLIMEKD